METSSFVAGVDYGSETVAVDFTGRPDVVAEAERRLTGEGGEMGNEGDSVDRQDHA